MPNIKSAKKRVKVIAKKKVNNNDFRSSMRTAIKNVEKATEKTVAAEKLNIAIQKIDKAVSKGLVHKNYAARQKSRLTKKVNEMK
ncbi:MAG: 30S ribosomal protein S20 [Firmicutes bacterium]|nr:30S ribosomal protein S20 [Bacillota bacterium]